MVLIKNFADNFVDRFEYLWSQIDGFVSFTTKIRKRCVWMNVEADQQ